MVLGHERRTAEGQGTKDRRTPKDQGRTKDQEPSAKDDARFIAYYTKTKNAL